MRFRHLNAVSIYQDIQQQWMKESYSLKDRDELGQAVEELFGIPQGIVKDAVGELRNLNDAWN